jgi:hypothetical protein
VTFICHLDYTQSSIPLAKALFIIFSDVEEHLQEGECTLVEGDILPVHATPPEW